MRVKFQYYMYARERIPVQHGLHMAFGHTKTSLVFLQNLIKNSFAVKQEKGNLLRLPFF